MALREDVALDIGQALEQVDRLERALTQSAQQFRSILADAMTGVDAVEIEVRADTSAIRPAVDTAVNSTDATVTVTATGDTAPLTSEVTAAVDNLSGQEVRVDVDTADAVAGLDTATQATDAYTEATDNAERTVGNLSSRLRLLAAVAATAFAVQLVRVGVGYNTLIQQASAAYETMLGTAEGARDLLSDIADFARTSPFPRQAFIEATQQMLAFGFAADEVIPTLDAIQQAVAASGGSAQDLSEIVRVFSQIRSTGRITAEDLNQLGQRGINAAELIGDAFGQTAGEIRSSISAGTIDADAAIAALTEGMATRFEGATDRVRDTFLGTTDRIRGAVRDISALLVSGIVDPAGGGAAVDIGNQLADQLRGLEAAIAPLVGQFNDNLLPAITEVAGQVLPLLFDVIEAGLPILGGLGIGTEVIVRALGILATILGEIPPEFLAIIGTVYGVTRALNLAGAAWTFFGERARTAGIAAASTNPWLLAATVAVTALSFVLGQGSSATSQFDQDVSQLSRTLGQGTPAVEVFTQALTDVAKDPEETFGAVLQMLGLTVDQFVEGSRAGADYAAMLESLVRAEYGDGLAGDLAVRATSDALQEQVDLLNASAMAHIRGGVATGEWTQAQVNAAGASILFSSSALAQVDMLEQLERARDREVASTEAGAAAITALRDALTEQDAVITSLSGRYPALGRSLREVSNAAGRTDRNLLLFAVAADEASLSGDELDAVAQRLGITSDELSGFIDRAAGALNDFANAASNALPTTSSVFQSLTRIESSGRSVPATMERAERSTRRYVEALADAREALAEALLPASGVDLERAEVGLARAQAQQLTAVERVAKAEEELRRVRFDAADQGVSVARLQAERELALRDAQLGVREAALSEIDAVEKLNEVRARGSELDPEVIESRERLADASRDLADAETEAAEKSSRAAGSSGRAAQTAIVTARAFAAALRTEATTIREFREDLSVLTEAGFAEVAAIIAREGPEVGGAMARELRLAFQAGDTALLQEVAGAVDLFNAEWSLATEFFRTTLGPEFILQAGLVGEGASGAFGGGLDFADRVRIAAELAGTNLSLEGQAIATIALNAGDQAARDYARLLDLEGPTVEEALAAADALRDSGIGVEARNQGQIVGSEFGDGLRSGLEGAQEAVRLAAETLAMAAAGGAKRALKIASPSQVAADEIGLPFAQGIALGMGAGEVNVVAAVDDLTAVMSGLTAGGDIVARVRTAGDVPSVGGGGVAGGITQGPLVENLIINTTDADSGMRAANAELAAIQRRGRS